MHLQVQEYIMVNLHINFDLPQLCQQQQCLTDKIRQWERGEERLKEYPRPKFPAQGHAISKVSNYYCVIIHTNVGEK